MKIISHDDLKTKIEDIDVIDGSKSIGFKRYVSNIMSWNIYSKFSKINKKNTIYNKIKTFLFQIDYGTIIGLNILLHPDVNKIKINKKNINLSKPKNSVLPHNKFNYWNETKKFISNNSYISNSYSIENNVRDKNIETLHSEYDFIIFCLHI